MTSLYKERYEKLRLEFECYLTNELESLRDIPEPVLSGIKYAMSAGGKRLRPVLALFCADVFGVAHEKVLPVCLAIELVHNYSLVHDDMPCMDNDTLRRGKPTVHVKYGEGMAVLIGDALLNLSMEILAKNADVIGPNLGKVLSTIYVNSGAQGMIGGQCVDLDLENKKDAVNAENVQYLHLHKTACLIKAPIVSVAIIANADNEKINALSSYADNLGLAFQITDDILDIEGDEKTFGKPIGSDKEKGKLTYPAVYGVLKSKEIAKRCVENAKTALDGIESAEDLVTLVESVLNRIK